MYERYTQRALRVVEVAEEEAYRLGHRHVGTEHILLGLSGQHEGIAARALIEHAALLEQLRRAVARLNGTGETMSLGRPPLTAPARRVYDEIALREALQLGSQVVGTEHLLLALIRLGEGRAAEVLASRGVNLEALRATVINLLVEFTQNLKTGQ